MAKFKGTEWFHDDCAPSDAHPIDAETLMEELNEGGEPTCGYCHDNITGEEEFRE